MAYQSMVTNDEGEPLGIETHYEDEAFDDDGFDFDYFDHYEDDPFRSEQESDLMGEWN